MVQPFGHIRWSLKYQSLYYKNTEYIYYLE